MISIVTVVKDNLHGFMRTRQSLEAQTFPNWEHIVVAASNGDSTTIFVGEMEKSGLVLRVQDGNGIYSAMNQGLAAATHDFVVFVNAGDTFAGPDTLDYVSSKIADAASKWFVFGGFVVRAGQVTQVHPAPNPDPLSVGCGKSNIMHPSVYYRKSLLVELGGFDESFLIAGDLELNLRAVGRTAPTVIDTATSIFFADGISSIRVFTSLHEAFRARQTRLGRKPRTVILSFVWHLYQIARAAGAKLRASSRAETEPDEEKVWNTLFLEEASTP